MFNNTFIKKTIEIYCNTLIDNNFCQDNKKQNGDWIITEIFLKMYPKDKSKKKLNLNIKKNKQKNSNLVLQKENIELVNDRN